LTQLIGRPVGVRAFALTALIAVGAGTAGAITDQYWTTQDGPSGPPQAVATPAGQTEVPTTQAPTTQAPATQAAAAPRQQLRVGEAKLKDQDYLDVETGLIGEVRQGSDLWWVGGYRELWTAGGGALPITRVDGRPDFTACNAQLATHDYDLVKVGEMRAGDWVCAHTAEGNTVAVQIRTVPKGSTPLAISYTVWQN
jgi:hypothetical protein